VSALLVLPIALPMLGAGVLLVGPYRVGRHRVGGFAVAAAVLVTAGVLLAATSDGSVVALHLGGWPAGFAISLAADTFAALMLAVTSVVTLACAAFAAAAGDDRQRFFVPLVLLMSAGGYGAFLAADLFNLFVLVEVMLVPSYVLLALGGGARLSAARVYVTVNLLASTVFLAGVGLLYGVTGTVNLGALAGAATASPAVAAAGAVVLVALAVKAAVVPLHGWLPRTYPHASPAVTALFSGLLTKVGVYALIRIVAVVYEGDAGGPWPWAVAAATTMVVGVLGALGESGMRSVLTFHMVSQIGYVLLGPALFGTAGLGAAIFYLVQYIPVKAALLLCAGAVRSTYGTDRLDRLGGLARRHRVLAVTFVVAALSLAGLPPFSGFVAKFVVLRAAAEQGSYLLLAVAVTVSLFTLLSMMKIWTGAFWGEPVPEDPRAEAAAGPARRATPAGGERAGAAAPARTARMRPALVAPAACLAALTVALGLGAQPLLALSGGAADQLGRPAGYARAVTAP